MPTITGTPGNDFLSGGTGDDQIYGLAGNDTFAESFDSGDDLIDGGEGFDTVSYDSHNGSAPIQDITANLATGIVSGALTGTDTLLNIEAIETGNGNDTIIGSDRDEVFRAGSGNNTISPGGGIDNVSATGNNLIIFTNGQFTAADSINCSTGTDTLSISGDYTGSNALTFQHANLIGIDKLALALGNSYDLSFTNTAMPSDPFILDGSALGAGDTLTYTAPGLVHPHATLFVNGGAGNDIFNAGGGNIFGNDGDDTLNLSATNFSGGLTFDGGEGYDRIYTQGFGSFSDQSGTVLALKNIEFLSLSGTTSDSLELNDDAISAGATLTIEASQLVAFPSSSSMFLDDGRETDGNLIFYGGAGSDHIVDGAGNDVLNLGDGDNTVYAGAGDDTITAGKGLDLIFMDANLTASDKIDGGGYAIGSDIVYLKGDYSGARAVTFSATTMINVDQLQLQDDFGYDLTFSDATIGAGNIFSVFSAGAAGAVTSHIVKLDASADTDGRAFLRGGSNNDVLRGGRGDDELMGFAGDDTLSGGAGKNTLYGGDGFDTAVFAGARSDYVISYSEDGRIIHVVGSGDDSSLVDIENLQFSDQNITITAPQSLVGTNNDDILVGWGGNDILSGLDGNDRLIGAGGNDRLRGGSGINSLDGGAGTDTAVYARTPGSYVVTLNGDSSYTIKAPDITDTLISIEQASFDATGQTLSLGDFAAQGFNPLSYIASYSDLIRGIGINQDAAVNHYMQHGYYEGRGVSFNALEYVASNADLIPGAGTNQSLATEHYILHGFYEGRAAASFDAMEYVASNTDLIPGAGTNQTIALTHYILHGYQEGRATTSFNTLEYVASNPDLIPGAGTSQSVAAGHYVLHGFYEGRATASFNALEYIASNTDLIPGAGTDQIVALTHYILHGYQEGRAITAFDPLQYIASYDDLIRGAGTNQAVGLNHYILHGFYEGRTASFDPVAYLLSNTALQNGQYDAQSAELQFVQSGFYQGKSRSGAFGSEQTQHALTLGTPTAGSLTSGDEDWFSINLTAGHTYDLNLSGVASSPLADPFLELHDAHGVLLAQDNDSGPGTDALIHVSATTTGTYYLVAASNIPGATGNYNILTANG